MEGWVETPHTSSPEIMGIKVANFFDNNISQQTKLELSVLLKIEAFAALE